MAVRWSSRAEQDLLEIALYIAADSRTQAETFVDRVERACFELDDNALRYALIPRYEALNYRRRPFERYAIIYTVSGTEVLILRIYSAARDLEALLDD